MNIKDLLEYSKSIIEEDLARNLLCALLNIKLMDLYTIYDKKLDEDFINEYKKEYDSEEYLRMMYEKCDIKVIEEYIESEDMKKVAVVSPWHNTKLHKKKTQSSYR